MEQETYLERIKKLKSQKKITNDKLSEMTGIPLGTLAKLLAGISDSPKLSNIVAISRALDCSLDWLITGVPENTNNYTLDPAEMTLVETYRLLDGYGRDLTLAVMQMERERAERQFIDESIRLHDVARRTARRSENRLHRPARLVDQPQETVDATAARIGNETEYLLSGIAHSASAETALGSMDMSPLAASSAPTPEALMPTSSATAEPVSEANPIAASSSDASVDPSVDESPAAILSVPRSRMDRTPAELRRRSIGLYDLPVSAGVGEFLSDTRRTDIIIPDGPRTAEADYALRISGNSMEPKYHSGDILLIQTTESVEEGELGIFILDGSGYFKKYGGDHLISLNPQYPPIRLKDFESVTCCGRVVGKLKRK